MTLLADLQAALAVLRLGPAYGYLADALLALQPAAEPARRALAKGDHPGAVRLAESALAAAQETDA